MKHFVSTIALVACCITLSQCNGGGAADKTEPTIRPKTLDGVVLRIGGNVSFTFTRNTGSPGAINNGDVETGGFTYSLGGVQLRTFDNTAGTRSDVRFPDFITAPQYSYRAINESAGVLTLTGIGSSDLVTTGRFNANNGSFVYLFESDSNGIDNNTVIVDITFVASGQTATSNVITAEQPGGDPRYDTVVMPSAISLEAGGPVPLNYNPIIDPNRPSRIAPESLNNRRFQFTNGIPDSSLDFSIQFAADATGPPFNSDLDEIGQGLLRVATSAVDNAVSYTYTRINGTDDATVTLSGSDTTFDGTYTFRFAGRQSGTYIGEVDDGTSRAEDVSGRFRAVSVITER